MWFVVVFIAAFAVAYAMQPKPPEPPPSSLSDFNVPTASPGKPIGVVFGTYLVQSPNVVWYGDLGYIPVISGGGK